MADDPIFYGAAFHVIELIFAYLPVIVLMRYRVVSKAFRDFIDSPHFANMHLQNSVRTRSNRNILCTTVKHVTCPNFYCPHVCEDVTLNYVDLDTLSSPVRISPRVLNHTTRFIGICIGVVLLYDHKTSEIILWNPAIRTSIRVIVPRVSICRHKGWRRHLGLGYDYVNDDYKVVMLVQHWRQYTGGDEIVSEVYVYSLKSNSWRRIQDFPYCVYYSDEVSGTYADSCLYWTCFEGIFDYEHPNMCKLLVEIDLATEEYRVVPIPVYDDTSLEFDNSICVVEYTIGSLEGCLYVHCILANPNPSTDNHLTKIGDTWLLVRRVGEEDSWTKLVSFDRPTEVLSPLAYSKCGKQLLLESNHKFLWYDLVTEEVGDRFNIDGLPPYFAPDVWVESMVHLDGGESDDEDGRIREEKVVEEKIDQISDLDGGESDDQISDLDGGENDDEDGLIREEKVVEEKINQINDEGLVLLSDLAMQILEDGG